MKRLNGEIIKEEMKRNSAALHAFIFVKFYTHTHTPVLRPSEPEKNGFLRMCLSVDL